MWLSRTLPSVRYSSPLWTSSRGLVSITIMNHWRRISLTPWLFYYNNNYYLYQCSDTNPVCRNDSDSTEHIVFSVVFLPSSLSLITRFILLYFKIVLLLLLYRYFTAIIKLAVCFWKIDISFSWDYHLNFFIHFQMYWSYRLDVKEAYERIIYELFVYTYLKGRWVIFKEIKKYL